MRKYFERGFLLMWLPLCTASHSPEQAAVPLNKPIQRSQKFKAVTEETIQRQLMGSSKKPRQTSIGSCAACGMPLGVSDECPNPNCVRTRKAIANLKARGGLRGALNIPTPHQGLGMQQQPRGQGSEVHRTYPGSYVDEVRLSFFSMGLPRGYANGLSGIMDGWDDACSTMVRASECLLRSVSVKATVHWSFESQKYLHALYRHPHEWPVVLAMGDSHNKEAKMYEFCCDHSLDFLKEILSFPGFKDSLDQLSSIAWNLGLAFLDHHILDLVIPFYPHVHAMRCREHACLGGPLV